MKRGTQIRYIPSHLDRTNDILVKTSPDVEYGFIERITDDGKAATCRFWRGGGLNVEVFQRGVVVSLDMLRTRGSGERVALSALHEFVGVPYADVKRLLKELDDEEAEYWNSIGPATETEEPKFNSELNSP